MSQAPFDPIATWQKFVSDWEQQINENSARVTGTKEFSFAMNQAAQYSLAAQQQFDKHMEQFLKSVHLPSKADIAALSDRLGAIEEALNRLTSSIQSKTQSPKTEVSRTRKPPPNAN